MAMENAKYAKYAPPTAGAAMRIINHYHYAISLEIDCFYALLTRQICA